ncbi:baseplate J/gp47 family protein [Caballeronia novacaledonica]|uniref:Baseplate protein J-like barrel domain-containing protein n=1 Tax=Caballeronia novacaledonica TaxID=1544861 RepID=A0AA37MRY9_9BURK|nr:baseplate J/gp47 family protein [Caballeronia novacaledonica]GJH28936.1 hypothetical protein CBA19CS42_30490 [Caballeronia novacaledonica]
MNPDLFALLGRTYPDLVDDLLTAVVGGVVNEPVVYDLKQPSYPLSQPAQAVRSVKGMVSDDSALTVFQQNVDYVFSAGDSSIAWQDKAAHPLDETTFYVDYFPANAQSPLTDINVGSVTRTLTEAFGREVATVYQEILNAYRASFIDTATGRSLEYVVSILGVTRRDSDFATGLATFLRDPAIKGNVTIPVGTRVATADQKAFETTELRTLQAGQQRLDVPIRAAGDANKGPSGVIEAGKIVTLDPPVAGIAKVTNFDATQLGDAPETDDALRARARATVQGLGCATLDALIRAVTNERSKVLAVQDPSGPPGQNSLPGTASLLVSTEPARYANVNASVQQNRAAGVLVNVLARYLFVTPRLALALTTPMTPAGQQKLVGQLIDALGTYIDGLGPGEPALGADMLKAVKTIPEAAAGSPRFLDVIVARADIDDPGAQPLVDALSQAAQGVAAQVGNATPEAAGKLFSDAIANVLAAGVQMQFGETRDAAPDLVTGGDGKRAADEAIEAGNFSVVPPPPQDDVVWRIALDMQPSDVMFTGA